jgi:hypothetical protein
LLSAVVSLFRFRNRQHLIVAEALHVAYLQPVYEHPVEASEIARRPNDGTSWLVHRILGDSRKGLPAINARRANDNAAASAGLIRKNRELKAAPPSDHIQLGRCSYADNHVIHAL